MRTGWPDEDSTAWRVVRFGMLGVVVTAIMRPFFLSTWYGNDEVDRYPGRLEMLFQHTSLAHPLPRWIPELAGGHGYPLFNFFNPGSMAMALPLRALGLDPFLSIKIALCGMLLLGGAHAMWLAERVFGRASGMLAATLYLLAPYTLANLYHRGDCAELWASLLFPVVAYHALALFQTRRARHFFALAAGWALLVPAHAFSALLFAIVFAVAWSVAVLREASAPSDRGRGLALVTLASTLGVAMAAIYWLPALLEKRSVHIDSFFSVERLMTSALSSDDVLDPTPEGRIAAPRRLTLGLWIPFLAACGIVVGWSRPNVPRRILPIALLTGCAFCLAMTTRHGEDLYRALPLIGQILFPYRFLSIATFLAVLAASQLPAIVSARRRLLVSSIASAITLSSALSYLTVLNPVEYPPGHSDFAGRAEHELVLFDYGEYFPVTAASEPRFFEPRPYFASAGCHVEEFSFRDLRHELRVRAERECRVTLRQILWLGWHATGDGAPIELITDAHGKMVLVIPPGVHRYSVWWEETEIERLATRISWIALAIIMALLIWRLARRDWRDALQGWWRARRIDRGGLDRLAAETATAAASTAYRLGLEPLAAELAGRALGRDRHGPALAKLTTARRTWRAPTEKRVIVVVLLCAATSVIALWPRAKEIAHTNSFLGGDPTFGAERAIDGMDTTAWLANGPNAYLDVDLLPPRAVREVELVDAHSLSDGLRSTERFRLEAFDGNRVVGSHTGALDRGGRATIPIVAERVDRVRVQILSWRGLGGGLTELRVR